MFYERKNRHFRRRFVDKNKNNKGVSHHANYIVGENGKNYYSFVITHSEKKGKNHYNYRLEKNPNKYDKTPAFMRKDMQVTNKSKFSKHKYKNYQMSPRDDSYVDSRISKYRSKFKK